MKCYTEENFPKGRVVMPRLQLVLPDESFRRQVLDYRDEFLQAQSSMDGTAGLQNAPSFDAWLSAIQRNSREETVTPGLVPATTFLAVRQEDGLLVGMLDLRHRLNDHLLAFGGHIGYSVRPSQRRQGYAVEMLGLGLEEARRLGLSRVLITCDKDNTASAHTICHYAAVLENEVPEGSSITQRYWVTL